MAKAWMPFYVADYLADTGHLDHEEHGIYMLSLFHYWQTEQPLKANANFLLKVCRCFDKAKFEQLWETVSQFYYLKDGHWHHKRLDEEILKARKISETRSKSGSKGGKAKAKAKGKQMPPQSQSQSHKDKTPCSPPQKGEKWVSTCLEIVTIYNEVTYGVLPVVFPDKITVHMMDKVKLVWLGDGSRQCLDWWREYFSMAIKSPFLRGESKKDFRATLLWLIDNEKTVNKVSGGYYGSSETTRTDTQEGDFLEEILNGDSESEEEVGTVNGGGDVSETKTVTLSKQANGEFG